MEVCPLLHSVLKYSIKLKPLGQAWHAYCAAKVSLYSGVVDCLGEYATSDDFKTLFVSMVNPNPSQRPKIEDIKKNKWFQRSIYTDKELYSIMKRNNQIPCLIKRT
mgnify:CR=1 FL=1